MADTAAAGLIGNAAEAWKATHIMPVRDRIPYAIGNFEEIIEDGYSFVDRTAYLRLLEEYEVPVFLRPRRFGKSLWCSLLECYYDVARKVRFEKLFGRFDIGRETAEGGEG